ncbi:MAG: hypothetical protein R3B70_15145 [Polyangiaceae bacterium]
MVISPPSSRPRLPLSRRLAFPLSLSLSIALTASACTPDDPTPTGTGGTGGAAGQAGTAGTGASASTGGTGGTAPAGGTGGSAGSGGTTTTTFPENPNCLVPEGASDLIHEGIVAPGLVCTRFPAPLAAPRDVLKTKSGRIFVSEFGAGRIVEHTPGGFVPIATGLVAPIGLREENATTLLVSEEGAQSVSRIDIATGTHTLIAKVGQNVTYLANGPDNAAYVSSFKELADTKKGIIFRVDLATSAATPFATGVNVPEGLFFDPQSRLHVAEWLLPSAVLRFPAAGGDAQSAATLATGFNNIYGLAPDGQGGLYAGDHAGRIVHVAPDGTQTDIVKDIARPGGIFRTPEGDLWIAEFVDFGQTGYLLHIEGL